MHKLASTGMSWDYIEDDIDMDHVRMISGKNKFGLLKQTGCTIGGPFPPSSQGTAVTCLSLTSSHHRPYHFTPPITLNMSAFLSPRARPQAGFPSATPHTHASREGWSFFVFLRGGKGAYLPPA